VSLIDMKVNRGSDVREYDDNELLAVLAKYEQQREAMTHPGTETEQ
jgi:hypothetical protein